MAAAAGNRCGHDPRRPRLKLRRADDETRGKPFPWLIARALERLEWLYWDRDLFPELGRRKRSERIEAMVLIGKALVRNMDILTMRCGRLRDDGSYAGISMETIAGWAQIETQRAYRACWDLRDAGWISIAQPIEKTHQGPCGPGLCPRKGHKGRAAIRNLKPKLFERLRLRGRLKDERRVRSLAARPSIAETIAQRRQLRRLSKASARAGTLAKRTTNQLAEGMAAPAPARVYTPAELAEMLRTRRRP